MTELTQSLIILVAGFLLSIVGALIGAWLQRKIDRRHQHRPLSQLLNFGKDGLLFIFPHRDYGQSILPRTSTEDFMAINNFISALINLDRKIPISLRDMNHVAPQDQKQNLVIICSPKTNKFTGEFQQTLKRTRKPFFYFFENDPTKPGTVEILSPFGEHCKSDSFRQEDECKARGVTADQLAHEQLDDFAVITKVRNPWNEDNIVILVAGIRGIGTWGAAELIKKKWRLIYDQLQADAKEEEFSALIRITYQEYDIKAWQVVRVLTEKDARQDPPAPHVNATTQGQSQP